MQISLCLSPLSFFLPLSRSLLSYFTFPPRVSTKERSPSIVLRFIFFWNSQRSTRRRRSIANITEHICSSISIPFSLSTKYHPYSKHFSFYRNAPIGYVKLGIRGCCEPSFERLKCFYRESRRRPSYQGKEEEEEADEEKENVERRALAIDRARNTFTAKRTRK